MGILFEVILINKFLGYFGEFYFYIFRFFHWRIEIEIADVEYCELCSLAQENAIDHEFHFLSEAVFVLTSPSHLTLVPQMVIRVRSGLLLPGRCWHSTNL